MTAALDAASQVVDDLESLLALELDGIVIATPSALHAVQAIAALRTASPSTARSRWRATAIETRARSSPPPARPTGCSASTSATATPMPPLPCAKLVAGGELGRVYAVDLVFHNAYGPDKPWFTQRRSPAGAV